MLITGFLHCIGAYTGTQIDTVITVTTLGGGLADIQ